MQIVLLMVFAAAAPVFVPFLPRLVQTTSKIKVKQVSIAGDPIVHPAWVIVPASTAARIGRKALAPRPGMGLAANGAVRIRTMFSWDAVILAVLAEGLPRQPVPMAFKIRERQVWIAVAPAPPSAADALLSAVRRREHA